MVVDGRCPFLDSSPLSLRATSRRKNFSSKFGAREVCIAPQQKLAKITKNKTDKIIGTYMFKNTLTL